nr:hypothetical protein 4 [Flavobacteriaceae bacterium]
MNAQANTYTELAEMLQHDDFIGEIADALGLEPNGKSVREAIIDLAQDEGFVLALTEDIPPDCRIHVECAWLQWCGFPVNPRLRTTLLRYLVRTVNSLRSSLNAIISYPGIKERAVTRPTNTACENAKRESSAGAESHVLPAGVRPVSHLGPSCYKTDLHPEGKDPLLS